MKNCERFAKTTSLSKATSLEDISPKVKLERIMHIIFLCSGFICVVAVVLISLYMVISGLPVIREVGLKNFLFGTVWDPLNSTYGILPFVLSSLLATGCAVLVGGLFGLAVSVYLVFLAGQRVASMLRSLVQLLAGIPSVVYGLLGAMLIVPLVFRIQTFFGLPTSGSLLAAIFVLVIMILPTIISVSENALRAVPKQYMDGSYALGASKIQTILKVMIPSAKSGIASGLVLGVGRAIGETMAVMMVAGNASLLPELLKPARLLTVGISIEWAYSSGLHRQALQGIGLVLFVFIMLINIVLHRMLRRGGESGEK